jgi:hypothetical protein
MILNMQWSTKKFPVIPARNNKKPAPLVKEAGFLLYMALQFGANGLSIENMECLTVLLTCSTISAEYPIPILQGSSSHSPLHTLASLCLEAYPSYHPKHPINSIKKRVMNTSVMWNSNIGRSIFIFTYITICGWLL